MPPAKSLGSVVLVAGIEPAGTDQAEPSSVGPFAVAFVAGTAEAAAWAAPEASYRPGLQSGMTAQHRLLVRDTVLASPSVRTEARNCRSGSDYRASGPLDRLVDR